MVILSTRYYGQICRCNACGCIIGYNPNDMIEGHYLKCPQCSFKIWINMDLNYDGIIREETKNDAVVSEQPESEKSDRGVSDA